jgi:hypothetical protein
MAYPCVYCEYLLSQRTLQETFMAFDAQKQQAVLDRFDNDEGFRKKVLEDANKAV